MHCIRLNDVHGAVDLSRSVLQVAELLGLYRAELARVLGVRCGEIAKLGRGEWLLQRDTQPWKRGQMLVRLFETLFALHGGNESAMHRWLRVPQDSLEGVPLLLMVDHQAIDEVLGDLELRLAAQHAR